MSVAVIDIGKTNAKVVLIADDGAELWERRTPNTVKTDGIYPHFDTDHLWNFVLEALSELPENPSAIVPVTHGACCALVKSDGSLALPVLDYEHDGPDGAAESYFAPPFEETGSPRLAGGLNVGRQLHWIERCWPDAFSQVAHILLWPQWWGFKLTGERATELTYIGCHTDLWNPLEATPSQLAIDRRWAELLPPFRPAAAVLGPILPEIVDRSGLHGSTPVLTGIHDSNASLLPYLDKAPCGVLSTGTWIIAMALGDTVPKLHPDKDMLLNVAADGRPIPTAIFMGGRDRDEALAAGLSRDEADRNAAIRSMERLEDVAADGPIYVEGPFAKSSVFLETIRERTGRSVFSREGSGTSAGASRLAAVSNSNWF